MSADNGIYILKTRGREHAIYRVAESAAIDNFDYYKKEQLYNLGSYMVDVWSRSPVFQSETDAFSYAEKLSHSYPILEYGISLIETDYVFYGDI